MSRIGWYVHHHGRGHLGRLFAIAPHLDSEVVCFSSFAEPAGLPANCTWIQLDRDDTPEPDTGGPLDARDPSVGGLLHWAPLLHTGHRRRLTTIATALERTPVTAFVVDVSAEVSLFVRLLGIPTVLITQPGDRDDEAHRLAFQVAATIIAPWPEELLRPAHLDAYNRVVYVGGISRNDGRAVPGSAAPDSAVPDSILAAPDSVPDAPRSGVLVLGGAGGTDVTAAAIDAAEAATGQVWTALGVPGRAGGAWSDDPWDDLGRADIVVAWAGQNSIADLAAANVRAVVIPQSRPFAEQVQTATAVGRAQLAVVEPSWPDADAWPGILDRARSLTPDWSRWRTSGAAQRAAAEIDATARGGSS